jgi:hypothetical protein
VTGRAGLTLAAVVLVACGSGGGGFAIGCGTDGSPQSGAAPAAAPNDAQHRNVTGPHGDHTPRHGGMVLMNGDVHYEIVFAGDGRHQIWFTDAIRSELPASVASGVTMEIARPGEPVEVARLAIDDSGEAWVASARPITGEGVMVKVRYALQGTAHEIEVPVVSAKALAQ